MEIGHQIKRVKNGEEERRKKACEGKEGMMSRDSQLTVDKASSSFDKTALHSFKHRSLISARLF